MTFEQRDILLVPIPFTDLTSTKRRPVLVLSNNTYNKNCPDILVSAITSKVQKNQPYTKVITTEDLETGALPVKSQVRCDKIFCLYQRLIIKKYGKLRITAFAEVKKIVDEIFYEGR